MRNPIAGQFCLIVFLVASSETFLSCLLCSQDVRLEVADEDLENAVAAHRTMFGGSDMQVYRVSATKLFTSGVRILSIMSFVLCRLSFCSCSSLISSDPSLERFNPEFSVLFLEAFQALLCAQARALIRSHNCSPRLEAAVLGLFHALVQSWIDEGWVGDSLCGDAQVIDRLVCSFRCVSPDGSFSILCCDVSVTLSLCSCCFSSSSCPHLLLFIGHSVFGAA